jgi:hypothetical protein
MNRYEITYKGKKHIYTGDNCEEAMSKFANRKVFGKNIIFDYRIDLYDADTRGQIEAKYHTIGDDNPQTIYVIKANNVAIPAHSANRKTGL